MGIMTIPAEMFDHPGKYIRVGFGRQNFHEILPLLEIIILIQNKAYSVIETKNYFIDVYFEKI